MTDTLQEFCKRHRVAPGDGVIDARALHVYRLGADGRYSTEDFVAFYDRVIDAETLAIDHGPGSYIIALIDCDEKSTMVAETSVSITNKYFEDVRANNPERVLRKQLSDEAWMHAGCLSIAEGVPDWNKPTYMDSLAMVKVRELRQKFEETLSALKAMQGTFIPSMEAAAYARGLRAAAGFLYHSNVPTECLEAIEHAAETATPVDSADPELARLEDLAGAVHDVLWDERHRSENIEAMARRVKAERDTARKERDELAARFLTQTADQNAFAAVGRIVRPEASRALMELGAHEKLLGDLMSTRPPVENADAHRDFDHFNVDEELRTMRLAIERSIYPLTSGVFKNIDEWLSRGGKLPMAWKKRPSKVREINRTLRQALHTISEETTEYPTWVKCMQAIDPDAAGHGIPKRLMKTADPAPASRPTMRPGESRCGGTFSEGGGYPARCGLAQGHSGPCFNPDRRSEHR